MNARDAHVPREGTCTHTYINAHTTHTHTHTHTHERIHDRNNRLPLNSSEMADLKFDLLAQPFHHMTITGMDVCVRKPLVVTCGLDKSIRIWNYVEHTLDMMKFFSFSLFFFLLESVYRVMYWSDCTDKNENTHSGRPCSSSPRCHTLGLSTHARPRTSTRTI